MSQPSLEQQANVRQITHSDLKAVHGYFDLCPWSPDGQHIVFTRLTPDGQSGEICIVPAEGGDVVPLAQSRAVMPNTGAMPQWSADGQRIYFRDRDGDQRLLSWVDVATGEKGSRPGDLRMICPTGNCQAYQTFVKDFTEEQVRALRDEHGVFIQDLDTGENRRIATVAQCLAIHPQRERVADTPVFIKHSKWSPDGRQLLFVFCNGGDHFSQYMHDDRNFHDLYLINADGSGLRRVGAGGNHPTWHPNNRELLGNCPNWQGRTGKHMVLTDTLTGEQRLLTEKLVGIGHPSFSPDGRWLVIEKVNKQTGEAPIYLLDPKTDEVHELMRLRFIDHSHDGTHLHPVWSRDGRQILVASDASGTAQLVVADVPA